MKTRRVQARAHIYPKKNGLPEHPSKALEHLGYKVILFGRPGHPKTSRVSAFPTGAADIYIYVYIYIYIRLRYAREEISKIQIEMFPAGRRHATGHGRGIKYAERRRVVSKGFTRRKDARAEEVRCAMYICICILYIYTRIKLALVEWDSAGRYVSC